MNLRNLGVQATLLFSNGPGNVQGDTARVPAEYSYLLPLPFSGNLSLDFVGGTSVANEKVADDLSRAAKSPFISYSEEFDDLLGDASLVTAIPEAPFPFTWAGEAGIWVPDRNEVWCVSTLYGGPTSLYVIDLEKNTVSKPDLNPVGGLGTHVPLANPAGGYYFNGTVYVANVGDEREPSSVVAINPETNEVTTVLNSYFGLEFPPVDDLIVAYFNTTQGIRRHIVSQKFEVLLLFCYSILLTLLAVLLDARPGDIPLEQRTASATSSQCLLEVHSGDADITARDSQV